MQNKCKLWTYLYFLFVLCAHCAASMHIVSLWRWNSKEWKYQIANRKHHKVECVFWLKQQQQQNEPYILYAILPIKKDILPADLKKKRAPFGGVRQNTYCTFHFSSDIAHRALGLFFSAC